ncbi:AtpZ/AtpI family protein [Lacibacterium aquatile]|uniref:AtpZ/AtpI family protein n=1 Tax=Lacibacterium aquatile TaxID=1168082 RepID=A0ABW5DY69_9PROT
MAEEETPKGFDERLKRLEAQRGLSEPEPAQQASKGGLNQGMRAGTDLVGGVLFGIGVGYGLDRWLDTKPWCLIIFFFLGTAAGFLNVYRSLSGYGYGVGYRKDGKTKSNDTPHA